MNFPRGLHSCERSTLHINIEATPVELAKTIGENAAVVALCASLCDADGMMIFDADADVDDEVSNDAHGCIV